MKDHKFTVKQSVWMTRSYGKPEHAVVTKVARKYAYIGEGYRQVAVDAQTGREKNGFGRAYTLQEWAERQRLDELHVELRAHGIGPVGTSRFRHPIETLEAILELVTHPTDPRPPECCGKCPPLARGGYDCTCASNVSCPNYRATHSTELVPAEITSDEELEAGRRDRQPNDSGDDRG